MRPAPPVPREERRGLDTLSPREIVARVRAVLRRVVPVTRSEP
jgi:hypothetical protein